MGLAENSVQSACLRLLEHTPGVYISGRTNNNAVYDRARGCYRKFNGIPGLSDIQALAMHGVFPRGTFAAIECKSETGVVSDDQYKYLKAVARSGNTAVVIRHVSELVQLLKDGLMGTDTLFPNEDGIYGRVKPHRIGRKGV